MNTHTQLFPDPATGLGQKTPVPETAAAVGAVVEVASSEANFLLTFEQSASTPTADPETVDTAAGAPDLPGKPGAVAPPLQHIETESVSNTVDDHRAAPDLGEMLPAKVEISDARPANPVNLPDQRPGNSAIVPVARLQGVSQKIFLPLQSHPAQLQAEFQHIAPKQTAAPDVEKTVGAGAPAAISDIPVRQPAAESDSPGPPLSEPDNEVVSSTRPAAERKNPGVTPDAQKTGVGLVEPRGSVHDFTSPRSRHETPTEAVLPYRASPLPDVPRYAPDRPAAGTERPTLKMQTFQQDESIPPEKPRQHAESPGIAGRGQVNKPELPQPALVRGSEIASQKTGRPPGPTAPVLPSNASDVARAALETRPTMRMTPAVVDADIQLVRPATPPTIPPIESALPTAPGLLKEAADFAPVPDRAQTDQKQPPGPDTGGAIQRPARQANPAPVAMVNAVLATQEATVQVADTVPELGLRDAAPTGTVSTTVLQSPSLPAAGPAPMIIQTIAQAAVALNDRPVELVLNPEELGRVRLTLQAGEGAMAVTITVERPETLELLRRHIDQLASQLRDIGYQKLTFEFADQGQQSDRQNAREFDPQDPAQDMQQHATDARNPGPHRLEIRPESGVDIRL